MDVQNSSCVSVTCPPDAQRVQARMSRCPGMGGPPTSGLVVLTAIAQWAGQVCQCLGTRQAHMLCTCASLGGFPSFVFGEAEKGPNSLDF